MGVSKIDFGSVELKERRSFKPLANESRVRAVAQSFKYDTASTGTPYIEVKFEIDDEDALDVDGGTDFGAIWDKIYFSPKSVKMSKSKLKGLGVDVDNLVIESEDDIRDLVELMRDTVTDATVLLVTNNEEYNNVLRTRVRFINQVS